MYFFLLSKAERFDHGALLASYERFFQRRRLLRRSSSRIVRSRRRYGCSLLSNAHTAIKTRFNSMKENKEKARKDEKKRRMISWDLLYSANFLQIYHRVLFITWWIRCFKLDEFQRQRNEESKKKKKVPVITVILFRFDITNDEETIRFLILLSRILYVSERSSAVKEPSFETLLFLSHSHTFLSRSRSMDPREAHTRTRTRIRIYTHIHRGKVFLPPTSKNNAQLRAWVQCKKNVWENERKNENAERRRTERFRRRIFGKWLNLRKNRTANRSNFRATIDEQSERKQNACKRRKSAGCRCCSFFFLFLSLLYRTSGGGKIVSWRCQNSIKCLW